MGSTETCNSNFSSSAILSVILWVIIGKCNYFKCNAKVENEEEEECRSLARMSNPDVILSSNFITDIATLMYLAK